MKTLDSQFQLALSQRHIVNSGFDWPVQRKFQFKMRTHWACEIEINVDDKNLQRFTFTTSKRNERTVPLICHGQIWLGPKKEKNLLTCNIILISASDKTVICSQNLIETVMRNSLEDVHFLRANTYYNSSTVLYYFSQV